MTTIHEDHLPNRIRCTTLVLLWLALGTLAGCGSAPPGNGGFGREPWFETEVLTGLDEKGEPRATVTVSIPYRRLVFFRDEDGYVSNYRVRAIQRVAGEAVHLQEWGGTARVEDFEATRAPKVLRRTVGIQLLDVDAPAEAVQLEVRVYVEGTKRASRRIVAIPAQRFREGGLTLGEPIVYQQRDRLETVETGFESMGRGTPDPSRFRPHRQGAFDLSTGPPWVWVRVFDLRSAPSDSVHVLTFRVVGASAAESRWTRSFEVPRASSETAAFVRIPPTALVYGENRIRISLAGTEGVEITVENRGLDLTDTRSWESNLDLIEIIARREEMKRLEAALPTEREERWREFWQRRDPDPTTPENEALEQHDRRVAYARAHLRDGFRDGALSDRGRIWILHGPPDVVETSATNEFDSNRRLEVWRYRDLGLVYYFSDEDGFGTYRLVWREAL